MQIKIADNIDDPFLKSEWERLEQECDVFPQSTYHWCSTWWKYLSGRRKLHVVIALDDEGSALGIAPLCIERHFGVRILRSFPIDFSDFYTFLVWPDDTVDTTCETLLKYITSHRQWRWVLIEKVREEDRLTVALTRHHYRRRRMTGCVVIDYSGLDWNGYLSQLEGRQRECIRRKYRKIHENFHPTLEIATNADDYAPLFDEMVTIHQKRWRDDHMIANGPRQLVCWRKAIEGQFLKGNMRYCRLALSGKTAAYRLGFVHRHMFYDWHMGYDPQYASYSVGVMILAFMIPQFIERQVEKINWMAGDYDWKMRWSPSRESETIWLFTSPSQYLAACFFNWYHHRIRDRLRILYHRLMQVRALRIVSRGVILFRQKLAGLR